MANDGISMRGITRADSSVSSRDAGKISGSNQSLDGLLGGTGNNGFQQMLDVQVQRKPASGPLNAPRKDTSANDKARRPGGNNSPPASSEVAQSRSAASRKPTRPIERDQQASERRPDSERAEAREMRKPASSTAKAAVNKSAQAETSGEKPAGNGPAKEVKTSDSSRVDKARTPSASGEGEKQSVPGQNTSAAGALRSDKTGETATQSNAADDTGEQAAPGNEVSAPAIDPLLVDPLLAGQVMNAETTPPAEVITVVVEGDAPLATPVPLDTTSNNASTPPAIVSNAATSTEGAALDIEAGGDLAAQAPRMASSTPSLPVMGADSEAATVEAVAPAPLTDDVVASAVDSPTEETPDPALKDLLTAMIRNREPTGPAPAAANSNAEAAGQAARVDSANAAQSNLAALARELQRAGDPATGHLASASTTTKGSSASAVIQQGPFMAASTAEASKVSKPQSVDVAPVAENRPAAENLVTATVVDITTPSDETEDIETLNLPLVDSEGEDVALSPEDGNDVALLPEEVSAEAGSPGESAEALPGMAREAKPQTATRTAPLVAPSTTAVESPDASTDIENAAESWSILDEVVVDAAENVESKTAQLPQSQEQQLALVRNELRNLERMVDGGLQGAMARSVARKEEKANDIKPAALSRALESLGAGAKAADLRPGVTVSNTPVAFGRQGFAEQMAEKIMLMTTQKVQVAEIRLDPKEMGTIDVKIRVHQDQASVVFSSPNPQVRDALEASLPRLREMFADAGVGLGSVNVNDRGTSSGGNEQSPGRGDSGGFAGIDDPAEDRSPKTPRQTNGLVDYYA